MINSMTSLPGYSNVLGDIRWHKRLIVAYAAGSSIDASVFRERIEALLCDLAVRDVEVHLIDRNVAVALTQSSTPLDSDSIDTLQAARTDTSLPFEMILIGKDGGSKAHSFKPHDLQLFLDLIDGMPMRRAEAAQQDNLC